MKAAVVSAFALVGLVTLLLAATPASAAGLVARDGRIHACYKAKGKHKGALRVVRAKAKCPKKWKKVAWSAKGLPGPRGEAGATGATGERGEKGTAGVVIVEELQGKVGELLTRVESLEAILSGVNNSQLKEAIAAVAKVEALEATVGSLCTQATALTSQVNALEGAIEGLSLNAVLTTLGGVLNIPPLPGPLSAYSCP